MKKTLCEALFFPKVAKNRNLVLAFLQYGVYIVGVNILLNQPGSGIFVFRVC